VLVIDVSVTRSGESWLADVTVDQDGRRTEHRVTVASDDLRRYGAKDVVDLVRRAFAFLLERESNTSILREFRITEIERYFPEFVTAIR
jgi:hypothetical protein